MRKLYSLLFLLQIIYFSAFSQATCPTSYTTEYTWPTHSKWYFGTSNLLSFGASGNSAATASDLTGSVGWYQSYESVASACDEKGNLVIATNGVELWDKNGAAVAVPGGRLKTGAEVPTGDAGSAVQGVFIVKHPLDTANYYIFTTDDAISGQTSASKPVAATYGFNYAVYNKVTNTCTAPTRLGTYRSTEQVAATWHQNGVDIWVVTHEALPLGSSKPAYTQRYNAYLLKCSGLTTTPVTSDLGFKVSVGADWQNYPDRSNERASLQFSWDGTKAAATHHRGNGDVSPISECVGVMNFNKTTGVLSGFTAINPNDVPHSNPYDCEFSPSGSRVYVAYQCNPWGAAADQFDGKVEYINVAGGAPVTVGTYTSATKNIDAGSLKLGGDGKIYNVNFTLTPWGRRDNVASVSNPDGAATWNATAIAPGAGTVSYGLPNMFVPPRDWVEIVPPPTLTYCDAHNFQTNWTCKATSAENTTLYENAYSILTKPAGSNPTLDAVTGAFTTDKEGTYKIQFQICTIFDTLTFAVGTCGCEADIKNNPLSVCPATNIKLDSLRIKNSGPGTWTIASSPSAVAGKNPATLVVSAGDTIFTTTINTIPGVYKLMYTINGATCKDSVLITVHPKPDVTVANNTICQGAAAATFTAVTTATNPTYIWKYNTAVVAGAVSSTTTGSAAGNYTVEIVDANTCKDTATATLTVNAKPDVTVANKTICAGGTAATFNATSASSGLTYVWKYNTAVIAGATTNSTNGSNAGTYTVEVNDANNCKDTASATLKVNAKPVVTVRDTTVCNGKSVNFTANSDTTGSSYSWSGGLATGTTKTVTFNASNGGIVTATVTDKNGCINSGTGTLTVNPLKDATITSPNDTMTYCVFDPDPTVTVAEGGGTWNDAAVSMVGTTATIDLSALGVAAGTYKRLIYTLADPCGDADTIWVSTTSALNATITQVGPYCDSDNSLITLKGVDAGGTWHGPGIVSSTLGTFRPSTAGAGTHAIEYRIAGNCGDTGTINIVVIATPDATILTPNDTLCRYDDPIVITTAEAGGTWTALIPNNNSFNSTTGSFNPMTVPTPAGNYGLQYAFGGQCPAKDTVYIKVIDTAVIVITPPSDVCSNAAPFSVRATPAGGTWSGSGISSGGTFTPTVALANGTNPITLTYSATTGGACPVSKTTTLSVNKVFDPTLGNYGSMCTQDPPVVIAPAADAGGTFSASCGACIDAVTGSFDPSVAGVGTHTITYSFGNPCPTSDNIQIDVQEAQDITITPVDSTCGNVAYSANLTASPIGGFWTYIDGPGSLTPPNLYVAGAEGDFRASYTYVTTAGCTSVDTIVINRKHVPDVDFQGQILQHCVPFTETFTDLTDYTVVGIDSCYWNFGNELNSSTQATVTSPYTLAGEYGVDLTVYFENGCFDTEHKPQGYITGWELPEANFEWLPNPVTVASNLVEFHNTSLNAVSYNWYFGDKFDPDSSIDINPLANFLSETDDTADVRLIATSINGCVDTVIKPVIIRDIFTVFIPNAFTPNHYPDGVNDTFYPEGKNWDPDNYEFMIFDRWGLLIWRSNKIGEGWDGSVQGSLSSDKTQQMDVYVWRLNVSDIYTGKDYKLVGSVTLVR